MMDIARALQMLQGVIHTLTLGEGPRIRLGGLSECGP